MKIEVTNQQPQIAVAIKRTGINMDQIAAVMEEAYPKVMAFFAEQGKEYAGVPYCAYMNGNEDYSLFDIELGIPIAEPVAVQGELFMSRNCEGKAITTTYQGPYKGVEAAYVALMNYAKENSLELTGVYYDYYLNNPADTPENELLTQVVFPIK